MKKHLKTLGMFILFHVLFGFTNAQVEVDYVKLVSRADITYNKPVNRSEEGLPIGNGRMGTLVWTTPTSLKFQVNRVDVFGNNTASNNFYERNTDYCGGTAMVDIDMVKFGDDVFTDNTFNQHLSCYDGVVATEGKGIKTKSLVWNENDVMAIQIDDQREIPATISAKLRMLRPAIARMGNHRAISKLAIDGNKIILTQEFREDDYYCASAAVAVISGRDAKAILDNENEVSLNAQAGKGQLTVFIASAASFNPDEDVVASATKQVEAALTKGFDGIYVSNQKWWKDYWDRSFVYMHSADGEADFIEKHYTYFMYVMGSASLGKLPPKFNGMLWTTGGDARKWGSLYWGANQSCLYNGLFPANRMELLDPMFKFYTGMYPSLEVAAKQQWGSKGIYIPETVGIGGLPEMPESIAAEMRDLYLLKKPWNQRSDSFFNYAATKMSFLSRWNWKKDDKWEKGKWLFTDKGGGAFGHVTHIFSRGAKIAYQYWQRYEYTRDVEWLRKEAYPMIKGMAEFYRNFPNVKKEKDGKYHIYHVNDNESVWGGHNTVEEISSMMGIFPVLIKASEILNVDTDMRPIWKEFLSNLSPLVKNTDYSEVKSGAPVIWVRALPPIVQGDGARRPDPNTMPVWFFDLCNLNSDNPEALKIANSTFDAYFPNGINEKTPVYELSKLPVTGTVLGRKEATKYLIPNHIRTAEIQPLSNRMTLREGYQTTSVQRLGRVADALHSALCQSSPSWPGKDPIIRLFPSWPEDWEGAFTLYCRGNFLVTSSYKGGRTEFVKILSQSGEPCTVSNPWPGKKVTLYRNNKKQKELQGDMLKFTTTTGETFILVAEGTSPDKFKSTLPRSN